MALNCEMQFAVGLDSNNFEMLVSVTVANSLDCPCSMLRDQRLRVGRCAVVRWKIGRIPDVSEGDTYVG